MSATIIYDGKTTSLETGQTATFPVANCKLSSDIVIALNADAIIDYNGRAKYVLDGQTATLACKGKQMLTDVEVELSRTDFLQGTWVLNEKIYQSDEAMEFIVSGSFDAYTMSKEHDLISLNSIHIGGQGEDAIQLTNSTFASKTKSYTYCRGYSKSGIGSIIWYARYVSETYPNNNRTKSYNSSNSLSSRTFTITSKLTEVENGEILLSWLRKNAVKQ